MNSIPNDGHASALGIQEPRPTPVSPSPSESADRERSPEMAAFLSRLLENLNTHQPGVPRGRNTGNCPQPEFSPRSAAENGTPKDESNGAAARG